MGIAAQKIPFEKLKDFLPEGTFPSISAYLQEYRVKLTITRSRRTILGNYKHPHREKGHRITVNGDLNKYAFLLTLLHELAHLLAYERFGNRISPHGEEWKLTFQQVVSAASIYSHLPPDIAGPLKKHMKNPSARTGADAHLAKALRKYDPVREDICLVEDLKSGDIFQIPGGAVFERGKKLRKRYECKKLKTGQRYLFSPLYEVKKVEEAGAGN